VQCSRKAGIGAKESPVTRLYHRRLGTLVRGGVIVWVIVWVIVRVVGGNNTNGNLELYEQQQLKFNSRKLLEHI
jgi:hypothetical protein